MLKLPFKMGEKTIFNFYEYLTRLSGESSAVHVPCMNQSRTSRCREGQLKHEGRIQTNCFLHFTQRHPYIFVDNKVLESFRGLLDLPEALENHVHGSRD
jgi:hypothetical protein